LKLHHKHSTSYYKFADGIIPEKLPLDRAKKLLGNYNISDEKVAMLIDELYKLSIITFKIFNEKEG